MEKCQDFPRVDEVSWQQSSDQKARSIVLHLFFQGHVHRTKANTHVKGLACFLRRGSRPMAVSVKYTLPFPHRSFKDYLLLPL